MDDMTWRSCMASEIFRNYIFNETAKEKANIKSAEKIAEENLEIMNSFEQFQQQINESPKLKDTFKQLQHIFATNQKYTQTVDPLFVEGVLLLKID